MAKNRQLKVVTRRPKGRLRVCVRRTRVRETATDEPSWFPSVALAGGVAAWADIEAMLDVNELTVYRFEGPRPVHHIFKTQLQVGSIVVRRNGAVAWIGCDASFDDARGHPRQCRKPNQSTGNAVHVGPSDAGYDDDSFNRSELLDDSPDIDPSSLRLKGSRLTWKHGAKRRHARLK